MAREQYFHENVEGTFRDPGTELFFMVNLLGNKAFKRNVNVKVLSDIIKTLFVIQVKQFRH